MNPENDKPEIKVTINPDGVIAPALASLKECSQSVLFGLKSSDQITKITSS